MRSVGRIGWLKNEFFPFVTEKPTSVTLDPNCACGRGTIGFDSCKIARGDFEVWRKTAEEMHQA